MRWKVFLSAAAMVAMVGWLDVRFASSQPAVSSLQGSPVETSEAPEIPVLRMMPAAEPVPALQYRLWPDRLELTPGNAFVRFQRAILLMAQGGRDQSTTTKDFWTKWNEYVELPPADLPTEEVRSALALYRLALKEAHSARLLKDTEYGLPVEQIRGLEMMEILLPEFQEMRSLARVLQLEVRLAIAEQRYDDAIEILQVGFRLGESTGQAIDFLVARLVGLAITGVMLGEVENLIQVGNSPNLYWALASLPPSTSEVLESIRFEASIMSRIFTSLHQLPPPGLPAEVWEERAIQLFLDFGHVQSLNDASQENPDTNARLLAGLAIVGLADYSRGTLRDAGVDPQTVEAMSPAEAMVRATARSIQVIQDDFVKWSFVPAEVRDDYWKEAESRLNASRGKLQPVADLGRIMANLLLPAMQSADAAGTRTQQMIARLVTIEAIRDYVAKHGQVPQRLGQLKDLPAWPDPYTGEPFGYERIDDRSAKLTRAERWSGDPEVTVILKFEE